MFFSRFQKPDKRRKTVLISCIILLVLLFCSCTSSKAATTSNETANLNALLVDLFGSDAVIYMPETGIYVRLLPEYVNTWEPTIKAVQLNMTPRDEEFYFGDLYTCIPAHEVFSSGEPIQITVTSNNPNTTIGGTAFRLDMQADGVWYAINRMYSWPLQEYQWTEGKEISYGINEYSLYRLPPMGIDPETGLFTVTGERDNSSLQLPKGTFRFSTWVKDNVTGQDYQLMCQFQVK